MSGDCAPNTLPDTPGPPSQSPKPQGHQGHPLSWTLVEIHSIGHSPRHLQAQETKAGVRKVSMNGPSQDFPIALLEHSLGQKSVSTKFPQIFLFFCTEFRSGLPPKSLKTLRALFPGKRTTIFPIEAPRQIRRKKSLNLSGKQAR